MLGVRIATRFLLRSRGQSILLICGIAVGIGVQVFLGSLITSLQASLVDETIGSSSQVTVTAKTEGEAVAFTDPRRTAMEAQPQITTVVPVRSFSAIYQKDSESAPLTAKGGELDDLDTIYKLRDNLIAGKAELGDGEVMVGKEFAAKYDVGPGDQLPLVLADQDRAAIVILHLVDRLRHAGRGQQTKRRDRIAMVHGLAVQIQFKAHASQPPAHEGGVPSRARRPGIRPRQARSP